MVAVVIYLGVPACSSNAKSDVKAGSNLSSDLGWAASSLTCILGSSFLLREFVFEKQRAACGHVDLGRVLGSSLPSKSTVLEKLGMGFAVR